jgi:hypothetical protein
LCVSFAILLQYIYRIQDQYYGLLAGRSICNPILCNQQAISEYGTQRAISCCSWALLLMAAIRSPQLNLGAFFLWSVVCGLWFMVHRSSLTHLSQGQRFSLLFLFAPSDLALMRPARPEGKAKGRSSLEKPPSWLLMGAAQEVASPNAKRPNATHTCWPPRSAVQIPHLMPQS